MVAYSIIDHPKYKYRLDVTHDHTLRHWTRRREVNIGWAVLSEEGILTIKEGYAWDGASGPAMDNMNTARASLIHDVMYQLIAGNRLPPGPWKAHADKEFHTILREDGVVWFRAAYMYAAVHLFGRGRDEYQPSSF